jgi:hypothetical protein
VLTILRLVFLNMTLAPEKSAYWKSRIACTTQIAIGWTIFSCIIPYLRPLVTAYERDGLSFKHGSSYKATSSSQGSRMEPRPPQGQSSSHHIDAAHETRFYLRSSEPKAEVGDENSMMRAARCSGGIQKTVKVELKNHEPTVQESTPAKEDAGAVAT